MSDEPPTRPVWLGSSGPGNLNVDPTKWGMTTRQWAAFIITCALTEKWNELEESTDRKEAGYVNLYQVCDNFVKPWTRGTGNSISLLMNASKPLKAQMMLSHAWGECLRETLVAVLARSCVQQISFDTPIWFCTFAQYQPGDEEGDCGPGVAAQLALDPFKKVIASNPPYGMLVIHTSKAELYGRLWCVFEVNEAEASGVTASAAFSMSYMTASFEEKQKAMETGSDLDGFLRVQTEKAECFSKEDAAMIRGKILAAGGFDVLDEKVFGFRTRSYKESFEMFSEFHEWSETSNWHDDSVKFLANGVKDAATFIGLCCLLPLIEAGADEETGERACSAAQGLIEEFRSDQWVIPEGCPPPPRFDVSKTTDFNTVDAGSLENVLDIMRNFEKPESFGQMMYGLLEMAAGGSEKAKEYQKEEANKLKETFKQFDLDQSGTISIEELTEVMRLLGNDFTDEEFQELFETADKNGDGVLDYDEFVDFLFEQMQG